MWIQQRNRRTNRLLCCCTTINSSCCCATPSSLLLKPCKTFGPGSKRAVRGAGPPYSSRYSHHRGNCAVHSSSAEPICVHVQRRLCPCASERCPQVFVVCTDFGSLLKKQNIKYRLGVILHRADISRVCTTYRENIVICDGDIRLDRHIIWL